MNDASTTSRAERVIAAAALVLLAVIYLATLGRPSFWLDEAWEANYYAGHTKSPWYNRPVLYMAAELAIARSVGPHEFAMRLMPCVAGIASIALTWRVTRRRLGAVDAWIAAGLLAIAPAFLEAAHQLKNYALDAFFLVVLVSTYDRYVQDRTRGRLAAHVGLGVLSFGFSFPSVIVIAAIGVIEAVRVRGDPRQLRRWIAAHGVGASAFVASYLVLYVSGARSPGLLLYFAEAWAPWNRPDRLLPWAVSSTARLLRDQTGIESGIAASLIVVAGLVIALRRGASWVAVLPVAMTLNIVASAFRLYPFGVPRLSVYLAPLIMVGVGASLGALVGAREGRVVRIIAMVALAYPLLYPTLSRARPYLSTGWQKEHIRPLVDTLAKEQRPGETIAVNQDAFPAFTFYWRRDAGNRDRADVVSLGRYREQPEQHAEGVQQVTARGPTLWTLLTHMPRNEMDTVVAMIAGRCRRDSSRIEGDARLDRWTCSTSP